MGKTLSDYVKQKENLTAIKSTFLENIANNAAKIDGVIPEQVLSVKEHNVDSTHGLQVDINDMGQFYQSRLESGFFTQQQIDNILSTVNNKGYISSEAGRYYSSLFEDDGYDIYIKAVNSSDVKSIMDEGIRCLGTSTSGIGSNPTDISQIKLANTVTKVDGLYDLVGTLKSSFGISQGMNPIDGTMIIKVPKNSSIDSIVYFNHDTNTYNILPEYVDSFNAVNQDGIVSEPIFNEISTPTLNTDSSVNVSNVEQSVDYKNDDIGVRNLNGISNPDVIEAMVNDGTITKRQVNSILTNLIGNKLASWIPSEEAGYSLYMNLLTACNNAGISMSDMKSNIQIMEAMAKYYEDARTLKVDVEPEYFDTYRTHGIIHIFDVLTQSINSYTAFKNAGINNLSLDTVMLAAVMHDTGMSGGQQIHLTADQNGNLVITTKPTDSSSKAYRESHSFNSAVNILNEFEALKSFGYTDLQIAEAALLTFAHSKSNSGLNPLAGNVSGWSFAIQALAEATKDSKFNIIDVLVNNGKLSSSSTRGYSTVTIKTPTGKVKGKVGNFDIDADWLNTMSYEGLIVRLGDALTNNDNAGTNQYGKIIDLSNVDYSLQKELVSVFAELGIDSTLSSQEQFNLLMTSEGGLLEAAKKEAGSLVYKIDGGDFTKSQQFVLGENNQTYSIRTASDGTVEVVISIKNSEHVPLCTLFAIEERAGEINSKGSGLFGYADSKNIKIVIEIDYSTTDSVKNLYQQYSQYSKDNGLVAVEINEVNNLNKVNIENVFKVKNTEMHSNKIGLQFFAQPSVNSEINTIIKCSDINTQSLTKEKVNSLFSVADYSTQKQFIDSIYNRIANGEVLNSETYDAIFNSDMFAGNSDFSKQYLHDTIVSMGSPELANIVSDIYDSARKVTSTKDMKNLHSYCDHTEAHVLQVAFLSMSSLDTINKSILQENNGNGKYSLLSSPKDYKTMFVSGMFHDLGMAAGVFDENGNPVNPAINSF